MTPHTPGTSPVLVESVATVDNLVRIFSAATGPVEGIPDLTPGEARAFAADLIETADYAERTAS